MEEVILVNEQDEVIGVMEKLEAHQKGVLHRAFSVLVTNKKGEVLLQRRAMNKYHSPGLWTNTCCSHPRLTETLEAAAHRRLNEEMGFDCDLKYSFNFIYKVAFDNGLFEHELDHVFVGTYEDIPVFNISEVAEVDFFSPEYITNDMATNPQRYTEWFKIIWYQYLNNRL